MRCSKGSINKSYCSFKFFTEHTLLLDCLFPWLDKEAPKGRDRGHVFVLVTPVLGAQ